MISNVNGAAAYSAYANNSSESKAADKTNGTNISKQGDMSKIEQLKEAIQSGEYKVNLQALSEKIAEELL